MAYAVLSKELSTNTTNPVDAFVGRVVANTANLRLFEKDFVVIPWHEWLRMKEESERG